MYFPSVIAMKIEEVGLKPAYFTCVPGEPFEPCWDIEFEVEWEDVVKEAKTKGYKVDTLEV